MYHQNPHYPPGEQPEIEYPPGFDPEYAEEYQRQQYYRQQQQLPPSYPHQTQQSIFTLKNGLLLIVGLLILWWLFGTQSNHHQSAHQGFQPALPVHTDSTQIESTVSRQVENTVPLVYSNQDGELKRILADADAYSEFVQIHTENLEQARKRLQQQATVNLSQNLDTVFHPLENRVNRFADWYFAYGTSYSLLWETISSATRHLNADYSLQEAVAQDLDNLLQSKYQSVVLKPEITDPQLQRAYKQSLETTHQAYLNILSVMQAEFQVFVAQHTTHVDGFSPINSANPVLKLDWHSQFNKVAMADYAKGSLGAVRGITLATLGGIGGKMLGREAGKVLFPKLIAPFASKAISAGAGGTAGGAVGTLGGPIGMVAGAGLGIGTGLGVDWLINEGIELVNREDFVADTQAALSTTRNEWEAVLGQSLNQVVDVWFTDTQQLLPAFEQQRQQ